MMAHLMSVGWVWAAKITRKPKPRAVPEAQWAEELDRSLLIKIFGKYWLKVLPVEAYEGFINLEALLVTLAI